MAPQLPLQAIQDLLLTQRLAVAKYKIQFHYLRRRIDKFDCFFYSLQVPPLEQPFHHSYMEISVQKVIDARNSALLANTKLCAAIPLHDEGTLESCELTLERAEHWGTVIYKETEAILDLAEETIVNNIPILSGLYDKLLNRNLCPRYRKRRFPLNLPSSYLFRDASTATGTTLTSPTTYASTTAVTTIASTTTNDSSAAVTTLTSTTPVLVFTQSQHSSPGQIPPSIKHKLLGCSPPSTKHKLPGCSPPSIKHKISWCPPPSIKHKLPGCSPTTISTTSGLPFSQEIITLKGSFPLRSSEYLKTFNLSLDEIFYSKAKIYLQIFLNAVSIVPG